MKNLSKTLHRDVNPLESTYSQSKNSKKNSELRDIHKILANQKVNSFYERSIHPKNNPYATAFNKRIKSRSKSQMSAYGDMDTLKKQKSSQAPINIFISVQKFNKLKINNEQKRTKRSLLYNTKKSTSSHHQLYQQDNPSKFVNRKKGLNQTTLKETIEQIKKNSLDNRKRFKTLQDQDLNRLNPYRKETTTKYSQLKELKKTFEPRRDIEKKSVQSEKSKQKEKLKEKPKVIDNQKLDYQTLKYDQERFPPGFRKYKLLGRGGFSLVWTGYHKKTKKSYAVKQILTKNKYQTHLKQIWLCNYFFSNGKPRSQFQDHPGVHNLLMMYDYEIEEIDTWIIYELCDGSLGTMLYDLYKEDEEVESNQDVFLIKYKPMYLQMRQNTTLLKKLIIEIAKTLDLLSEHNIVHSDLKTQNILIQQPTQAGLHNATQYTYKLIDYGSSFPFTNLKQYTLATPQYMCPELLNYILYQNKHDYDRNMLKCLKSYQNNSAIDVWGLGCVILQIINGLPLWISNPTKIFHKGQYTQKYGYFAVENRNFKKIIEKQLEIVNDFDGFFDTQNFSGIKLDDQLKSVIKRMLDINPATRIRPRQIMQQLGYHLQFKKFSLVGDLIDE